MFNYLAEIDNYLILQPENQITASLVLNLFLALKCNWFILFCNKKFFFLWDW